MGWGLIRIALTSIAFIVGLTVVGPLLSPASSKSLTIPRLNERAGESLVVTCESGNVVLRHVEGKTGAVQLECSQSKIVVVRDHREREISHYHLLGM